MVEVRGFHGIRALGFREHTPANPRMVPFELLLQHELQEEEHEECIDGGMSEVEEFIQLAEEDRDFLNIRRTQSKRPHQFIPGHHSSRRICDIPDTGSYELVPYDLGDLTTPDGSDNSPTQDEPDEQYEPRSAEDRRNFPFREDRLYPDEP